MSSWHLLRVELKGSVPPSSANNGQWQAQSRVCLLQHNKSASLLLIMRDSTTAHHDRRTTQLTGPDTAQLTS